MPRPTALVVLVPEAQPHVLITHVPAHVTILVPFVPLDELDVEELREIVAAQAAFDFVLDRVERFDSGIVWLRPEPSEPFAALTRAVYRRWPDYPPYEGVHETVIPHLTVSEEPVDVDVPLPIPARASEVTLIEEAEPSVWVERLRFPLG
jgi:2'-5' RNA ligase superfamily protein